MTLLAGVRETIQQHGVQPTYWIAYSGGLDSHVLLHLFYLLRADIPIKLRAIHINHSLSPNAQTWAQHCQNICAKLEIELVIYTLQIPLQPGASLEEVAREHRYAIFAARLAPSDILLTAHHQDDQAETVLLQLMRGAGIKGLAAMPIVKSLGEGIHRRALLNFSRQEIKNYAQENNLSWIEDESNQNIKFKRNYFRQVIMPLLKSEYPSATTTIARSAKHCAETQTLLDEMALEGVMLCKGARQNTLSVSKLLEFSSARQRLVLRAWIAGFGYRMPDAKKLASIQRNVLSAAWDKLPCVYWGDSVLRRYRDDLFVMPAYSKLSHEERYTWELSKPLVLPGLGILEARSVMGAGLQFDIKNVEVRFRQGGEVIELPNRGRHTLKNLFNEWQVVPWERSRIPLIYSGEKCIAVLGYYIHADFSAREGSAGWLFHFHQHNAQREQINITE